MAKRGFSGLSAPCKGLPDYRCQATLAGGEGKFEGEGGFSGTLPPLQGQFVMQFAELPAKIFRKGLAAGSLVPSTDRQWHLPRLVARPS